MTGNSHNLDRSFRAPDEPSLLNVNGLFAGGADGKIYLIPNWQRDYSWDADEEVRLLLEDLKQFFDKQTQSNYTLGSFITHTINGQSAHVVVDGQQRIVTLYLLTIALRDTLDRIISNEYQEGAQVPRGLQNLQTAIKNLVQRTSLSGEDSLPLVIEFGNANIVLQGLANSEYSNLELEQTSQINIMNAYQKCADYLSETFTSAFELASFARVVLEGTFLTENMVKDMKQALDIFLKINIRGKQLEGSDYLKNYLFRNLGPGYDFETLADTWEKMSSNLRSSSTKREKLKTPEFFLRNWALLLKGEKVGGDNAVFEFWENRFDSDQNRFIREFLDTVQGQSKNFARISSNKLIDSNDTNSVLDGADYFKGTQYLPVLLGAAKLENYAYVSELVNFRYLFYILSQERTQDFESMIPKWAHKINNLASNASIDEIIAATRLIDEVLIKPSALLSLENKIPSYRYGSDTRKIRMILGMVAKSFQQDAGYDNVALKTFLKGFKSGTGFDIDHIYPQSKILSRRLEETKEETLRVEGIYHSVGNLILVNGLQRTYSDKDPVEKTSLYLQDQSIFTQCLAPIPADINSGMFNMMTDIRSKSGANLENWDDQVVYARSKYIAKVFTGLIPNALLS
jgi:uncharacterized protein with ParB-like and HNH nuclease domain